jgi:hypothetical protein
MKYTALFSFCLLFISCSKSLQEAERSLVGSWKVTKVITSHGNKNNLGVKVDSTTIEDGALGDAVFDETTTKINYTSKKKLETIGGSYLLTKTRVNSGFVKVDQFQLIVNSLTHLITFGNQTSGSTKDAKMIEIQINPDFTNGNKSIILNLTKL